MKRKNIALLIGIAAVTWFITTGCSSLSYAAGNSLNRAKNYGDYDKSSPASQKAELRLSGVMVKSFNNEPVRWGNFSKSRTRPLNGRVFIPAGEHSFTIDIKLLNSHEYDYDLLGDKVLLYQETAFMFLEFKVPPVTFLPGHKYFIGSTNIGNGNAMVFIEDMTSIPVKFIWGDKVAKPPSANRRRATAFEGTWKSDSGIEFIFRGNTWESTAPPGTAGNMNKNKSPRRMKGTFRMTDSQITLHITGYIAEWSIYGKNKYADVKAARMAEIYNYSFSDGDLWLEAVGNLPNTLYRKQ